MDLGKYKNPKQLLRERQIAFAEKYGGKKIDHSFQELGVEMSKYFKDNIWFLFSIYSEEDMKYAFEICKRKEIFTIGYMRGIIKNKYKPKW